ncbi:inositol phosphorylceramide glucuronosyltransferase 1-like [Cicer arietinum]|uniref:Hexosyltransferase n=1 Tax=Cicer arietinum TaxID=3827 RepID=A0A1S2XVV3_CICAR|nr:inositol phosphorylceramide glucuronosyltransferase 1-like [Cicer arietinum]
MKPITPSSWLWLLCFIISLLSLQFQGCFGSIKKTDDAYVTLLYGDEFLLGVRVLGKSIRDTRSNKDMVVLVSDGVSDYAKNLLTADGWIVEQISLLANPNRVRPKRFWGVYTKLKIFNMTNYKKVVYLDADTIVVKNIDDLFKCRKFCANLKHSERLNSGVMVVEPSETVFNDMVNKIKTTKSYTGGDQGFLNSYYSGFPNAHLFDPNLSAEELKARPVPEMERLSTLYNADVGLYMLANKWMVDEKELRVIHYTLGPLKPWDWWTSWLLKPVDVWQDVREQLAESLPGTKGGQNPNDSFLVKFLFLLPVSALLFCCYRSFIKNREYFGSSCRGSLYDQVRHLYYKIRSSGPLAYSSISTSATNSIHQLLNGSQHKVPAYLGGISVCVCLVAAVVSLGLGLLIVPRQVMPWTGLLLMYEWTFTMFIISFGGYLHLVYQWGKFVASRAAASLSHPESLDYDSGKRHQRQMSSCDTATWYYGLGMALLAIGAPSLPCLFGITALFLRLGLMVVGGIILASFMTYASEHLAIRSFLKGLEEWDIAPNRSLCFLC